MNKSKLVHNKQVTGHTSSSILCGSLYCKSIIPTMSSSVTAKLIIMSTPRGTNKFYEVWQKAVKGTNNFNPIRVDWWEVPLNNEIGDPLLDENGNIVY